MILVSYHKITVSRSSTAGLFLYTAVYLHQFYIALINCGVFFLNLHIIAYMLQCNGQIAVMDNVTIACHLSLVYFTLTVLGLNWTIKSNPKSPFSLNLHGCFYSMGHKPTFCNCVSNLLHSSFFCSMAISSDLSFESFFKPDDARDEACSFRSMRLDCRWTHSADNDQCSFQLGGLSRPHGQGRQPVMSRLTKEFLNGTTRCVLDSTAEQRNTKPQHVLQHTVMQRHHCVLTQNLSSCILTDLLLC